jgi:hypothetical protein
MTKGSIAAALACAALAMPWPALADDAMGGGSMMKHDTSSMATMMCRHAKPGEKPTAMMAGDAKTGLVCKTMQPDMMMKKDAGPKTAGMTAEQVDAAWRQYIQNISVIPGGTGGG